MHFNASQAPINVARDRLDILCHFPNDWYKNIEGYIEKIKIDVLPSPKMHLNGNFGHMSVFLVKAKHQF